VGQRQPCLAEQGRRFGTKDVDPQYLAVASLRALDPHGRVSNPANASAVILAHKDRRQFVDTGKVEASCKSSLLVAPSPKVMRVTATSPLIWLARAIPAA
jgi:hypothetical protein